MPEPEIRTKERYLRLAILALMVIHIVVSLFVVPATGRGKLFIFSAWRPFQLSLEPLTDYVVEVEDVNGEVCDLQNCKMFSSFGLNFRTDMYNKIQRFALQFVNNHDSNERDRFMDDLLELNQIRRLTLKKRYIDSTQIRSAEDVNKQTGFTFEVIHTKEFER